MVGGIEQLLVGPHIEVRIGQLFSGTIKAKPQDVTNALEKKLERKNFKKKKRRNEEGKKK